MPFKVPVIVIGGSAGTNAVEPVGCYIAIIALTTFLTFGPIFLRDQFAAPRANLVIFTGEGHPAHMFYYTPKLAHSFHTFGRLEESDKSHVKDMTFIRYIFI